MASNNRIRTVGGQNIALSYRPCKAIQQIICVQFRNFNDVVQKWQRQTRELTALSGITSVNIFENKGEVCGISSPHPHGQIYATNFICKTIERHLSAATTHYKETKQVLFQDILLSEAEEVRESSLKATPWWHSSLIDLSATAATTRGSTTKNNENKCVFYQPITATGQICQIFTIPLLRFDRESLKLSPNVFLDVQISENNMTNNEIALIGFFSISGLVVWTLIIRWLFV